MLDPAGRGAFKLLVFVFRLQVVQFKQQSRLEEKRKKALDLQLDFIVGQTEKYSDLLTQSLNETLPVPSKTGSSHNDSTASSPPPPAQLIEDEG